MAREITLQELDTRRFIEEKVRTIREKVGDGIAINALSGGVDSSTVTLLGHQALANRLKTVFIENGLMREGEANQVVGWFRDLGVTVDVVDARHEFFAAWPALPTPKKNARPSLKPFIDRFSDVSLRKAGPNTSCRGQF